MTGWLRTHASSKTSWTAPVAPPSLAYRSYVRCTPRIGWTKWPT